MRLKFLLAGAALALSLTGAGVVAAKTTVIGAETDAAGFTGPLFPGTSYLLASDGESAFMPFGATFDTSDGLNFSTVGFTWTQAADSSWTSLGSQTWVLPATTPCGSENEPKCEPVGHFISPGAPWTPAAIGDWVIQDPAGGRSDLIRTFNTASGAELRFFSDPLPEPATWTMLLLGVFGLGATLRGRRKEARAV